MATQVITPAAFATLCAECADAIAAGNRATAFSKYAQAQAVAAALNTSASTQVDSYTRMTTLDALNRALDAWVLNMADEDDGRFIVARTKHS